MKRIGIPRIRELLPAIDSATFSPEVFREMGVFVVRGAIPPDVIDAWQKTWNDFYAAELSTGRKVNRFNPVAVDEVLPPTLAAMHKHPALLDVVEKAFGPDIALYNQRMVVKDVHSRGPVFLHQDSPYHIGWSSKASAFVPLSAVSPENGGMIFYPGTHQFGYLGDAGEINPSIIDPDWPTVSPSLSPGDIVLMNSSMWHCSGPHVDGPDRVLADIIYQPADDPSGIALLRGEWRTEIFLDRKSDLFVRSRVSRLVELQRELDGLRPNPGP